ncbi:uncharacterized protein LOC110046897 isoform X2 [Orbicella faveolata]|uniref:uncharacterized protein LOC110046897 isoform X2 n=1 Tax=Orbicella faveolata TaxID=48498 RepID=UPI0009E34C8E|nr:uncharacterized protein LOC110046897 isoform X2 [Orbicella faveolata]
MFHVSIDLYCNHKWRLGEREMLWKHQPTDSKTLIPITFKFPPPKSSQLSVPNSSTSLQNKTLASSSSESGPLLEFLPAYSGKSCLQQQRKSSFNNSGSDDGIELQSLFDGQRFSDLSRQCVSRPKLPSEKSKLPQEVEEVLNPMTKSLWCANPPLKCRKRKEKELVLEKLKQTKLSQVKELHKLNNNQRGKWILGARNGSSLKGKNSTTEQLWKKVCSLIKEGHLPYCNAKLQETQDQVWVYCDFGHALKVRSTLENALGNVEALSFYVHPVGVVMEL